MNFSTSLICCKMQSVARDIETILEAADGDERFSWMHADFMDGHFVPRLGISPELVRDVKAEFGDRIHVDSHLMISDPFTYMDVIAPYSDWVVFHSEAVTDPVRSLQKLRRDYPTVKSGVAFSLASSIDNDVLKALKDEGLLDGVMLMGISPGVLGTRSFPSTVLGKLEKMRGLGLALFIDGYVYYTTIPKYGKFDKMTVVCGSSSMLKVDDKTQGMSRTDMIKFNVARIKEASNE